MTASCFLPLWIRKLSLKGSSLKGENLLLHLRCMGTFQHFFSAIFTKGDNLSSFLFAFPAGMALLEQILSFESKSFLRREADM